MGIHIEIQVVLWWNLITKKCAGGLALTVTVEQIQQELAQTHQKLRENTTSQGEIRQQHVLFFGNPFHAVGRGDRHVHPDETPL